MNQVHEANKIIESGCDDFAEFLKKSAGLGLHPETLGEIWNEYWSDVHAEQEESRAVEQHYAI